MTSFLNKEQWSGLGLRDKKKIQGKLDFLRKKKNEPRFWRDFVEKARERMIAGSQEITIKIVQVRFLLLSKLLPICDSSIWLFRNVQFLLVGVDVKGHKLFC